MISKEPGYLENAILHPPKADPPPSAQVINTAHQTPFVAILPLCHLLHPARMRVSDRLKEPLWASWTSSSELCSSLEGSPACHPCQSHFHMSSCSTSFFLSLLRSQQQVQFRDDIVRAAGSRFWGCSANLPHGAETSKSDSDTSPRATNRSLSHATPIHWDLGEAFSPEVAVGGGGASNMAISY